MSIDKRNAFVFYRSFYEAIYDLPDKNKLEIFMAIADYSLNFKEPKLTGLSKTIFTLIKPQLDANIRKYENGKKPKTKSKTEANNKQIISKSEANNKQNVIKSQANVNDNVNVNVKDNENINKKEAVVEIYLPIFNSFYEKYGGIKRTPKTELENLINLHTDWKETLHIIAYRLAIIIQVVLLNGKTNNAQNY